MLRYMEPYSNNSCSVPAGKDRRASADFIGAENTIKQINGGPTRRRVGMVVEGAPARRAFRFLSCNSLSHAVLLDGAKIYKPGTDELLGENRLLRSALPDVL